MSWLAQLKAIPRTDSRSEAADKTDETPVLSVLSVLSGRRGERYLGPAPSDDPDADDNDAREERAAIIEFDGGMTRAEAERVAGITKVNANSEATLASDGFTSSRWPFEEWGDLRPCLMCRRLSQRRQCLAAEAGDLQAAWDYVPVFPGQPRRCVGYLPNADDPVQTSGRTRWPELSVWQLAPVRR